MRKLFNTLFVIIAAMVTFAGCAKEEVNAPANETKTVQFIAESIESKTAFGTPDGTTYPTLWTANDKSIYVNMNGSGSESSSLTVSDDFKEARFEVDLKDDGSGSYKFLALSPSSVKNNMTASVISANIWSSQTPLENSVDEAAQVLYAVSDVYTEFPSSVALTFKHFTAYGKLSFTNLNLNGAKVTSVAVTSSVDFAGRWNYNVGDGTFTENSGASTITLNTASTENIWFACAPVGSMNGQTLTFTINTDKGPLSKEVTLSGDKYKFEAGKIAKMVVDMAGIEFAESVAYDLVTDVAELTAGSKIIIAAKDYNYALGTTQNSNNRGQAAVTKGENTIKDPGNDVQVITIEEGSVAGTLAFNVGNGYLYAASSSSNYLRTEQNLSANSSWSIEIASDGTANVVANGTNTRNTMQYNQSSSIFSCYGSASQKALSIYKLPGSNYLNVSPESIEVDADATSASFTVSSDLQWTATSEDATVTIDGNTVTVAFDANTVEEVKTYTVTVTANGVDPKTVTITQKEYVDTSKIEELTVAEFLNAPVDENVYYKLKGTITSVANTSYGNFDLTDDTGTVHIYGLYSADGTTNKYWASSGAKLGDDIIISVTRGVYNNVAQGTNARFVELVSPGTRAFFTLSTTAVDFSSAGGEQVVTVAAYNTDATVTASSDNPQFSVAVNGYNVTISSAANELENNVEGNISVKVGNLEATVVKVALAAKPAAGIVEGGQDDFHTISSTNTSYISSTTTSGWSAKNCAVLKGGTSDSSPKFKMIGDESNRAFCMNGKTSAVGTITSPDLTTGCGTLKFSYGLPFSDTKIKFRVDIKQNGSVVKTFTVAHESVTKLTKYEHEEVINVSGIFQIVFTNLSPSNSTSNKDRTAIWDVEWTGCN